MSGARGEVGTMDGGEEERKSGDAGGVGGGGGGWEVGSLGVRGWGERGGLCFFSLMSRRPPRPPLFPPSFCCGSAPTFSPARLLPY